MTSVPGRISHATRSRTGRGTPSHRTPPHRLRNLLGDEGRASAVLVLRGVRVRLVECVEPGARRHIHPGQPGDPGDQIRPWRQADRRGVYDGAALVSAVTLRCSGALSARAL